MTTLIVEQGRPSRLTSNRLKNNLLQQDIYLQFQLAEPGVGGKLFDPSAIPAQEPKANSSNKYGTHIHVEHCQQKPNKDSTSNYEKNLECPYQTEQTNTINLEPSNLASEGDYKEYQSGDQDKSPISVTRMLEKFEDAIINGPSLSPLERPQYGPRSLHRTKSSNQLTDNDSSPEEQRPVPPTNLGTRRGSGKKNEMSVSEHLPCKSSFEPKQGRKGESPEETKPPQSNDGVTFESPNNSSRGVLTKTMEALGKVRRKLSTARYKQAQIELLESCTSLAFLPDPNIGNVPADKGYPEYLPREQNALLDSVLGDLYKTDEIVCERSLVSSELPPRGLLLKDPRSVWVLDGPDVGNLETNAACSRPRELSTRLERSFSWHELYMETDMMTSPEPQRPKSCGQLGSQTCHQTRKKEMSSSGHAPTRRLSKTDYRRSNACRELAANRFPEKLHPKPSENRARKTYKTSQRRRKSRDVFSQSEHSPRNSPMNKSWGDLSICDLVSKKEHTTSRNKLIQEVDERWEVSQLIEMEELLSPEISTVTKGFHRMAKQKMQAFTNARSKVDGKSRKAQVEFLASCSSIAFLLDSYQEKCKHENDEDEGKSCVVSFGCLKQIQESESNGLSAAPTRPHTSKPSRARKGPRHVLSVSDHTGLQPTPRKNETKGSTSKNTGLEAMDCDLTRTSIMLKKTSETIGNKMKPNSNNARSEKAQLEPHLALEASQIRYHAAPQETLHKGVPQVIDLDLIGKGLDADGEVSDVSSSTPPLRRRKALQEKRLQRSQSMRDVCSPSPRSTRARGKSIGKKTQHEKGRVQHSHYFRDLSSPLSRVSHRGRRKSGNGASASPQTPRIPVQRRDWPTDTRSRRTGVENHERHDGPKKATKGLSAYPTKIVERSQSLRDLFRDDERRNMDSPNRDPGTPLSEESAGDSAGIRKPSSWRDLYNKSPRYVAGQRISGTQSTLRPPSGRSLGRIDSLEACGRRSRRSGSLQLEDPKETPLTPTRGLERSNGERNLSEVAQTGLLLATYRSPEKMPRRRSDVSRGTQPTRNIVLREQRESKK